MAPIAFNFASIEESSALTVVLAVVSAQVVAASVVLIVFMCACGKKEKAEEPPADLGPVKRPHPAPASPDTAESDSVSMPTISMASSDVDVDEAPRFVLMSAMEKTQSIRPAGALGSNPSSLPTLILMDADLKEVDNIKPYKPQPTTESESQSSKSQEQLQLRLQLQPQPEKAVSIERLVGPEDANRSLTMKGALSDTNSVKSVTMVV